ncbi:MAG: hypothetical protein GX650_08335 [Clostridiales bacterium]|nr:hypothetical protein [Clostridiales bacterium]
MYQTLDNFRDLLKQADPDITKDFGRGKGDYTVWSEYELDGLHGGNSFQEMTWRILVERFTHDQNDPIVPGIMQALMDKGIAFQYSKRRSNDQELLYHAWDCEVIHGEV